LLTCQLAPVCREVTRAKQPPEVNIGPCSRHNRSRRYDGGEWNPATPPTHWSFLLQTLHEVVATLGWFPQTPNSSSSLPVHGHGPCWQRKLTREGALRRDSNRYLAIVPAHNEAGAIAATVAEIRQWAPEFDVLVVDDGSVDDTARRAASPGVCVLRLPYNLGIGGAVQTGYIYARDHDYDVAVQVDGDGQHDASEIPILLDALLADPAVHMVTGSRFLERGNGGDLSTPSRRAGNRVLASLLSLMTRQRVTDATSGFRIADRRAIELFAENYPHDYPEVEAILLMHAHRLSRIEVPARMRPRTTGVSTISAGKPVYYMAKVILALVVGFLRARPAESQRAEGPAIVTERVA
jgi:hypothetical protein